MAIIQIRGLRKSYRVYQKQEGLLASFRGLFHREYREVEAVRGIDLDVEQGEFVAFLGPNGAGKTTTLKLLSGVISPTAGEATVMGFTPWQRANEYRRRFALVMGQKNQLWWDLPAAESFRLHQQIYRLPPDEYDRTTAELTDLLSVGKLLNQPVRELSLGERMKMELIAALLHRPEVLFLDEPTIGLDVVAQHKIQQFLKHYQETRGTTVLLTSHYMKDIAALCRRVVIIANGRLMYDGSLAGIVDRFSGHKVLTLQFADDAMPTDLARFGEPLDVQPPKARIKVERERIADVLSSVLSGYQVADVSVEDPPLEEVIAEMFATAEDVSDSQELAAVST
ncbi:putative ABC transporter ATP-binding protein YbhF [Botrimarina colliarenosi]|uniref:Putative ABC transporter ATP-binding protein YbhF n=1 Tax=Botrimarina colliarenosi TaxID=2528001 RepID=A0A5C6ACL0_9BACT|nr:ABC transporter ATP-binding protein [Botrimarina colliarenosi]TWT97058.1 putative ABC transporter ATP-binding protein YbhF [Botrimarina colliarenosi]